MKAKRIISLIAAVTLLFTMCVFSAQAALPAEVTALLEKYQSYNQDLFNSNGVAAIQTAIATLSAIDAGDGQAVAKAQAADAAAQAGMKKNLADGAWIPYSQRATYEGYVKDGVTIKDYAIATAADWLALVNDTNVAAGKPANRFNGGYTFHFTADIDMKGAAMAPVGYGDEFNGYINGHDHVLKNINLKADSTKHAYIGLVDNVIWGGIQNLGIESGTITVTGNTDAYVGAFAGNLRGAYIRKCWNAASINIQKGKAYCIGGIVGNCTANNPVIDGCYNIGTITSNVAVLGLQGYGGNQAAAYNSFGYGSGDFLVRYHANIIGENCKLPIANTYTAGGQLFSWNGTVPEAYTEAYNAFVDAHTLAADVYVSGELAYKLNAGYVPTGKGDGLRIWYTNGNGKVFFGTEANQTRKITFQGAKTDVYYLAAGSSYDMEATFGVSAANSAFITTEGAQSILAGNTLTLANEDITIKIINDCTHSNGFEYVAADGIHTKTCKDRCGYSAKIPCTAQTVTADATDYMALAKGEKATHTGICTECGNAFTKECDVEYIAPADKTAEHYWSFDGCACGREAILNSGSADLKAGDANGDGAANLLDGIAILRALVGLTSVNEKNGDADGDGDLSAADAAWVVRSWLGDANAKAKLSALEAKLNANLFQKATAQNGFAINMDGSIIARTNNYVSAAVAVEAGDTIVFGPVRLGQPVLGYTYNAQGGALDLINYANVTVRSTFEEGLALVEYTVPANGATIKLNVPASDADIYLARINSNMYADEYAVRAGVNTADLSNPLYKKNVLTVGDSICEAARDVAVGGLKGWASSIYQEYDANVTNSGVSGASLSEARYKKGNYQYPNAQISNQIAQHAGSKSFEYILIHGGINDAWDNVAIGSVSNSFDPSTFDITTYAGGLEMAIYTAVRDHGNTAAIGYHINFAAPYHSSAEDWGNYIATGKAICAKWGIRYIDIYELEFDTRIYTADYIHPNEEGYDVLGEYINPFMLEMRPVSLDVWTAVQETL